MTFFDILDVLGLLLRALGSLVFGLGAGWLTMHLLKQEPADWRVRIAAFLGLPAAFVLLAHWVSGFASLGGFGLGAGAGLLIWGLAASRQAAAEED